MVPKPPRGGGGDTLRERVREGGGERERERERERGREREGERESHLDILSTASGGHMVAMMNGTYFRV